MAEAGGSMYRSECCLHFCAKGGAAGVDVAADILERPVVNPSLLPDSSLGPGTGMSDRHLLPAASSFLWTSPRVDRPDEAGNTPLYYAILNGEFALARLFLAHGASCHDDSLFYGTHRSLLAQIFEDGLGHFASQLEFLLETFGKSLPFVLERSVFDCPSPPSTDLGVDLRTGRAGQTRWPVERGNILTAMSSACAGMEREERVRLWDPVLAVFGDASHLLAKSQRIGARGDEQDALQIAIANADRVSARVLIEKMSEVGIFTTGEYSVIGQARGLLLGELPASIFDSPIRKRIVSFRLDLGAIIRLLLGAGDMGNGGEPRADMAERILEVLSTEFGILVVGFKQRGVSARDEFKQNAEDLCNAMATAVYDCLPGTQWAVVLDKLERGLSDLLSEQFITEVQSWVSGGSRGVKISLHFRDSDPVWRPPLEKKSAAVPLLDSQLYQKLWQIERLAKRSPQEPLPALSEIQIAMLASLGFRGEIPNPELLTARALEVGYPSRRADQPLITDRPDPAYFLHSRPADVPDMVVTFQSQQSRRRLLETLRQIEPSTEPIATESAAALVMRRLHAYMEDRIERRPAILNPEIRHPLFGRIRTDNRYLDLLRGQRDAGELPDGFMRLALDD